MRVRRWFAWVLIASAAGGFLVLRDRSEPEPRLRNRDQPPAFPESFLEANEEVRLEEPEVEPPRPRVVKILVTDRHTRRAVPSASVHLDQSQETFHADGDGAVDLEIAIGASVRATVVASGYVASRTYIGDDAEQQFALVPATRVRGEVLLDSGAPASGAALLVASYFQEQLCEPFEARPDGTFESPALERLAEITVVASLPGRRPAIGTGPPGTYFRMQFPRGATISGTVRDSDGKPIPDAQVIALYSGERTPDPKRAMLWHQVQWPQTRTDARGRYRLDGLTPDAAYVVHALDRAKHRGRSDAFLAASGQVTDVDFPARGSLVVTLRTPDGRTEMEADVALATAPENDASRSGGGWSWSDLPAGEHTLHVRPSAWAPIEQAVAITPQEVTRVVVRVHAGDSLEGRVLDGHRPIGDADLYFHDGVDFHRCRTDEAGRFRIEHLGSREGQLWIGRREYFDRVIQAKPGRGALTIRLRRAPEVRFRVVGAIAPDRFNIGCKRVDANHYEFASAESQGGGVFEFFAPEDGDCVVSIEPLGDGSAMLIEARLRSGARNDLGAIRFDRFGTLSGRVTTSDDEPIANAVVETRHHEPVARVTTDTEGRFRITGLRSGLAEVVVEARGFAERRPLLRVGSPEPQAVALERAGRVVGRLLDRNDLPLGGAWISARRPGAETGTPAWTSGDGTFTVELAPGDWTLFYGEIAGPTIVVRLDESARVVFRVPG